MTERRDIQKAVVIGAGAMGSGIAAQLTNAGVQVHLLDIVPKDATERSIIAQNAIQRMLKANPASDPLNAGFMDPDNARLMIPGNIEDDLESAVKDADWIVEAVIENLDIKRKLFARLETLVKPEVIISSNTSTMRLESLVEGRSAQFQKRFAITHFFNPPRFMHLLELVGSPTVDADVLETLQWFGDIRMGKNVIICKDTPAFLANRIGIYFMFRAITEAIEQDAKIEDVDAVLGSPIGFPKEGIFGLLDLVGIGIIPLVTESLLQTLEEDDPFRLFEHERGLSLVKRLLAEGCTGRNSPKGGFYRMQKNPDGTRQKQAVSLQNNHYYDVEKTKLACVKAAKKDGPRAMFETNDKMSHFAWVVVRDTLLYASCLVPEIADDLVDIDAALRGGYNAHWGPFEIIDRLGVEWFCNRVKADGIPLTRTLELANNRPFYREFNGRHQRLVFDFENHRAEYADIPPKPGVFHLAELKREHQPILKHYSASLWDIGDGVTCLEFHSKMNTLDPSILWVINQSIQMINASNGRYKAMVIYNEEKNFSLGANLGLLDAGLKLAKQPWAKSLCLSGLIQSGMFNVVEAMIFQGQSVFKALKEAPFPVVGAPNGMALGGGCEILLHCDRLQASAETYMGLVESGVGLIPGWGGCIRYLARCEAAKDRMSGPMPPVRMAFQTILMPQAAVSTSAVDARKKLWLQDTDGITMNWDRLLSDAKALALSMAPNYKPAPEATYRLPGPGGKAALRMAVDDFYTKGDATYHDVVVADALADVLTGGDTDAAQTLTENDLAQLERQHFLSLLRMKQTQVRIAHTLKTGKPLRENPATDGRSIDAIRQERVVSNITQHILTGKPLEGIEAIKLRLMAEVTAFLLKQVAK